MVMSRAGGWSSWESCLCVHLCVHTSEVCSSLWILPTWASKTNSLPVEERSCWVRKGSLGCSGLPPPGGSPGFPSTESLEHCHTTSTLQTCHRAWSLPSVVSPGDQCTSALWELQKQGRWGVSWEGLFLLALATWSSSRRGRTGWPSNIRGRAPNQLSARGRCAWTCRLPVSLTFCPVCF